MLGHLVDTLQQTNTFSPEQNERKKSPKLIATGSETSRGKQAETTAPLM